jgi:hypothetical protein
MTGRGFMPLSTHGLSRLAVPTVSWLAIRFSLSIRPPQASTPTSAAIRAKLLDKHLGFGGGELRYQYSLRLASGSTNGYKRGIASAPLPVMSSDERERWCSRHRPFRRHISRKTGRRCESVHSLDQSTLHTLQFARAGSATAWCNASIRMVWASIWMDDAGVGRWLGVARP